MTTLDMLGQLLADVPVYLANGILMVGYWLAANAAGLACLGCAGVLAMLPDAEIQNRAGFRPRRGNQVPTDESGSFHPRTAQIMTGLVLVLWMGAQTGMAEPVPWIGTAMWAAGLLAVLGLPAQRFNLLWYVKAGIAVYALAVIGSRLYLSSTIHLSAAEWTALIGSSDSAAAVLASTRGNVTTIILWALWLIVPLGFFSMLIQQVFINPMSIVSPLAGAQDLIRALRVRE